MSKEELVPFPLVFIKQKGKGLAFGLSIKIMKLLYRLVSRSLPKSEPRRFELA